MKKADLIKNISDKTGIPHTDVTIMMEALLREVKETLRGGESIFLRGFGTFTLKKRKRKIGRIIKKNEAIVIPEHYIPHFKPADVFKDLVRQAEPKKRKASEA